ncbi:TPA: hypothetical protein ACX6S1_003497 [Photobacterium damselae]
MNKKLITLLVASTFSVSVLADIAPGLVDGETDTTSASVSWEANVPTVMPGKWITFRGEGGSDLKPSTMEVKADGSFVAEPVKLELWYYDADTKAPISIVTAGSAAPGTAGTGVGGKGVGANAVKYSVEEVSFTAGSSDVSTAEATVTLDGTEVIAGGAPVDSSNYTTAWNIEPKTNINKVVAGDNIQAQTLVTAEVAFADLP